MSRFWRTAAISAAACGVLAAGITPAIAQSAQTTPSVTIFAKTADGRLDGYTAASFKDGKYSRAVVSGSVSDFAAGEVAQLYAQPFPYKAAAAPVTGQQLALTGTGPETYSFTSTPGIATRYSVEILPSSTTSSPAAATSGTRTVYVVTTQPLRNVKTCNRAGNRPVCHESFHIYTRVPASAYRAEARKKTYFYFGLKLSRTGAPSSGPKYVRRSASAVISKPKRISSTEFEQRITLSFKVYEDGYWFAYNFCSKASESSDGINLPGHHGCGNNKVRPYEYLG